MDTQTDEHTETANQRWGSLPNEWMRREGLSADVRGFLAFRCCFRGDYGTRLRNKRGSPALAFGSAFKDKIGRAVSTRSCGKPRSSVYSTGGSRAI